MYAPGPCYYDEAYLAGPGALAPSSWADNSSFLRPSPFARRGRSSWSSVPITEKRRGTHKLKLCVRSSSDGPLYGCTLCNSAGENGDVLSRSLFLSTILSLSPISHTL